MTPARWWSTATEIILTINDFLTERIFYAENDAGAISLAGNQRWALVDAFAQPDPRQRSTSPIKPSLRKTDKGSYLLALLLVFKIGRLHPNTISTSLSYRGETGVGVPKGREREEIAKPMNAGWTCTIMIRGTVSYRQIQPSGTKLKFVVARRTVSDHGLVLRST
ncbi:hypothetical protein AC579_8419 [Pseudocercospora musae]|uniref:Uncharacterized protein n=1 Tax=Pseudocercospora musae TaxID=113226 RepID=A0A139IIB1_9PEZI|nr:hypothetical protein AC579_8419 [Pseudocercospora musae]